MSFDAKGDLCLGFWKLAYEAGAVTFPPGAHVLEIGCAEADWLTPMLKERPDLVLTGIDVRACQRAGTVIQGDILTYDFPAESFDAIVLVSALEHVGLGSYGDPLDADGDSKTLDRCVTWLKPGGWIYADVPYRPEGPYSVNSNFRAYDPAAWLRRLVRPGLVERWASIVGTATGDGPYRAVVWERQ